MTQTKYALIIIDMQNDFVLPGAPAYVAGDFRQRPSLHLRGLLDVFRGHGIGRIFHVIREYRAD